MHTCVCGLVHQEIVTFLPILFFLTKTPKPLYYSLCLFLVSKFKIICEKFMNLTYTQLVPLTSVSPCKLSVHPLFFIGKGNTKVQFILLHDDSQSLGMLQVLSKMVWESVSTQVILRNTIQHISRSVKPPYYSPILER